MKEGNANAAYANHAAEGSGSERGDSNSANATCIVNTANSKLDNVKRHYAEVACDSLSFVNCCETCDTAPASWSKSEAEALYGADVLQGIPAAALAASRGCGDPVARALLKPGETVLDLGSGGGIDAIIAARLVGAKGHVFGLDMTPEMVRLARQNAQAAGLCNLDFLEGRIECVPLPDASVDVVISNCVINFCENKRAVMKEAFRVLKPGGRFVVSDIVRLGPIPEESYKALCALVGCTNGMSSIEKYRNLLTDVGFESSLIDPKTVYTLDVLEEKSTRKNREHLFSAIKNTAIDSVSGSAIVFAFKAVL